MELNGGLYIATFDHARKKMKFNMEPKEMGEKNEKKHPDPSSAQKVLSAPSHLSVSPVLNPTTMRPPSFSGWKWMSLFFFTTTCYNKQEEPVQNLEKVICVSFYLKNFLFSVGKKSKKSPSLTESKGHVLITGANTAWPRQRSIHKRSVY